MDAVTVRLPEMRAALQAVAAAAAPFAKAGKPEVAAYRALVDASTRLRIARSAAAGSPGSAMDGNADGTVKTALGEKSAALEKAGVAATAVLETRDRRAGRRGEGTRQPRRDRDRLVEVAWSAAQGELVRLSEARIAGFEHQRLNNMGVVACALLLGAMILFLVIRSIRRPMNFVLTAINRFQSETS